MNWVSFSIYGDNPKYVEGAVRNAERVPKAYPGFRALFFLDSRTTPKGLKERLEFLGAEVRVLDSMAPEVPRYRMLWRLLALDDPQAEIVLFRDADSRITRRECAAVAEWLDSGLGAHSMRDFPYQTCRLGGGHWGVRKGKFPGLNFQRAWEKYQKEHPDWETSYRWLDQVFLERAIWPVLQGSVMQHDEFTGYPGTRPFPVPFDPEEGFVAEIYEVREGKDCCIPHHRKVREEAIQFSGMNKDTRIVVCCYAGDQHYVIKALDNYLQHKRPVVVLSPEDSKAEIRYPGIENRFGGKRAYIGQDSLDRQRIHLQILLDDFPEGHFLIHDSDSICLSPQLPQYLYDEPDHVWSNLVNDDIPQHGPEFESRPGWPRVAFQPPYFLSRKTIQAMLSVADRPECKASPIMPFIDFYMVQLTMVAGLSYRRFPHCVSCSDSVALPCGVEIMSNQVREQGAIFIHSVKRPEVYHRLLADRRHYLETHK